VRILASALGALTLTGSAVPPAKIAFRNGSTVTILYPNGFRQPIRSPGNGAVGFSGDGRLLSIGGTVVGRITLPATRLEWSPIGETAAYVTKEGGVATWSPAGRRTLLPNGWGATTLAWNRDGSLAIGRAVCKGACGRAIHKEVWVRSAAGARTLVAGPLSADQLPMPFAWWAGKPLWWDWPGSGSVAADGVLLYDGARRVSNGLMYRDYVSVCGNSLAVAAGGDRYAMHGKRILFNGTDVSRDPTRSWVSPSCAQDGTVVAAASRNTTPTRIGREHRAIWQLLPTRRQLTHPPAGMTDEYPQIMPDTSVLFIRTRTVSKPLALYGVGTIELLGGGKLTALGTASRADNYYGHYAWPDLIAVAR
jgi:hypothetical protein